MKQCFLIGIAALCSVGLLQVVFAENAASRYSRSAERGAWPVHESVENGGAGDTRFVATPPALSDLKTLDELQASGKIIAVLLTGWDWCEVGSRLLVEWRKGFGEQYITTVYDFAETDYVIQEGEDVGVNVSARSRENAYAGTLNPLGGSSSRAHVYPAIALYDSAGKLFALERGVEYMDNAALKAMMDAMVANYNNYAIAKAAANAATEEILTTAATNGDLGMRVENGVVKDAGGRTITLNIYKAALLANALLHLEKNIYSLPYLNMTSGRQDDFNQIAAWDPQDVSGAMRRVKLNDLYSTAEIYRKSITDALKASLATLIDDTRLIKYSDNEYQQALLCGYNLYRFSTLPETAEVYARKAIEKNPASFWAEGARGHLWMTRSRGPVLLGWGWRPYHLTVPGTVTAADGSGSFSGDQIMAQDGLVLNTADKTFKWIMRYGNDRFITYQGWHSFVMKMTSGSAMTVTSLKIWTGAATKDDPTTATLVFDGTSATNAVPTNGDDMAAFTAVEFPKTVNTSTPLSFNFYLPTDVNRLFPLHEKDWSDQPKYNDVAIVIEGTYTGTSSGSFSVNPILKSTALTAPEETQILIDDNTLSIGDVLAAQQNVLQSKEPLMNAKGEVVADAVENLLNSDTPDEAYITALTRAEFFYEHESSAGFSGMISNVAAKDKDGVEMLNAVLADRSWMTDLMISGPAGVFGPRAGGSRGAAKDLLHRLCAIWRTDKLYTATNPDTRRGTITAGPDTEGYDVVIRRMATVGALNAAPVDNGNLGQTHWLYRDHMDRGVMHGDFYTQSAAQMRYSLNPQSCHVLELAHAVKKGNTKLDIINGTAWQTAYLVNNFFGDSIFGSDYYTPWASTVMPGTAMGREIGAVCGGISYYGVLAANASGRRSIAGGQPGHCAAMHRTFDGTMWEIDSNVGAPTGSHFPLWEIYSYQAQEYYDDMWSDPNTLTGYRLLWAARLRALRYGETEPGVEALYARAVKVAPLCYQAILDYRDFLKRNYPQDADRWLEWAEAVTYGLWRYPSIGWPLLNANMLAPLKAQYGNEAALATFKQLHVRMHDSDRKTREKYNYTSATVDAQVNFFPEDADFISLLSTAMDARYGTDRFTNLVNWANSRYTTGDVKTTYQTMLQSVYEANGNPLGVKATCLDALLRASRDGDLPAFREMSTLYANLFQDENYPELSTETAPFTQEMLSAEGMVTLSSYPELNTSGSADDLHSSAESFCHLQRLIDDSAFGTYAAWTQEQYDDPWIMVQMPGDVEVFGILLQNGEGALPLTVEISPDAQTWTPLVAGRSVAEGATLQVSFDGSQVSRYIRVRYANTTGTPVRLKLNKVQVFARKRY